MAIEKLNKTVVSGERARATDFNSVSAKVDEIIDSINGITAGTIAVPKATSATSATTASRATSATQATYATHAVDATTATNDADGNEITDTYATKVDLEAFDNSLNVSAVFEAARGDKISTLSTILDSNVRLYATIDGIFADVFRGITSGGNHMIYYHYLNSANELQTELKMFIISDGVITITYEGDQ